jgi:hypothetical protein
MRGGDQRCSYFDKLSTNGKFSTISVLNPFALSLSKGMALFFLHKSKRGLPVLVWVNFDVFTGAAA